MLQTNINAENGEINEIKKQTLMPRMRKIMNAVKNINAENGEINECQKRTLMLTTSKVMIAKNKHEGQFSETL